MRMRPDIQSRRLRFDLIPTSTAFCDKRVHRSHGFLLPLIAEAAAFPVPTGLFCAQIRHVRRIKKTGGAMHTKLREQRYPGRCDYDN